MIYLIYVLSFGSIFLLKYLKSEGRIKSRKELSLVVLFPMVGYRNLFNRENRAFGTTNLPRSWYIWRKMVFQNFWLIILLTVYLGFLVAMDTYYTLLTDGAIRISSGEVLIFENNVDPTLGIGEVFSGVSIIVASFSLLIFLVLIPFLISKSLKRHNLERNNRRLQHK